MPGHHRAQDRGFRVGVDEGHVGVPRVGALTFSAVQFEQITRAFTRRYGRVRHRLTEQMGEGFLTLIIKLGLLTEEHDFVLNQCLLNRFDRVGVQLTGQMHATDLGADTTGHRMNFQRVDSGFYCECGIAHG